MREADGTWGLPERLDPEMLVDDTTASGRQILEITEHRYRTAARFVRGGRVLDIACGTGYGTPWLRQGEAAHVVGVDLDAEVVARAARNYAQPGIEFRVADANNFPTDEMFDVVISFGTIEHLHSPLNFLRRMREILSPHRRLILSLPLGETRHLDAFHLHIFTEAQTLQLLREAGFTPMAARCDLWKIGVCDLLHWRRRFPSQNANWRQLVTSWRGWYIGWSLLCGRGFLSMPVYTVAARPEACSEVSSLPLLE